MNLENYKFLQYCSDTIRILILLRCAGRGQQLWTKVQCRKDHVCAVSNEPIAAGTLCFKPITNAGNRMDRISEAGLTLLIRDAGDYL